ncbi:photosystem II reaction center protein Psb28 [Desertifilum sp. FACHB-1129]|uniref:Photosystem II reaction center Psb28 protein n=2 Tax=Desertifilum tharense IPPAS B-1220 TaxID=1781255 RepID=A0A1E5QJD1_9CYAN|nr:MULTISPECIES: photosystem II reaction center protein Psb28 [Desertifilum]MCD8487715.1 photosystem II reaction center protein Psb28 [Desertifilum sp.]MDA0211347.1 photosystem II reaction center protein Psb28 [Cyanobacteria bacterium FC1]MDI9637454.1 photosystem II reaction center protein Psb28 [Geitlerinema splendidum]NES96716.1 photosystem II reaction center protein Psb28 [Desertifilum sp. SIO1I2]MBD2313982.1 photosystem II reaction center protein Psb28 [Desertifilum sp. FACHB-1129]
MAEIQFSRGIAEEDVPDVRLTRSKSGTQSTATFIFDNPTIFQRESNNDITGMYLIDEEGEISTSEVKAKFINGQPAAIEAFLLMNTQSEWERFMRFMERYAKDHGLEFTKS